MKALGESRAAALFYLLGVILGLAVGIVNLALPDPSMGSYFGAAASFLIALLSLIRFLCLFLGKGVLLSSLILRGGLNILLVLPLAFISFKYQGINELTYFLSLLVMAFGITVLGFKESHDKDGKTPQSWRLLLDIPLIILAFFLFLDSIFVGIDHGFQGAASLCVIPLAVMLTAYILPGYLKRTAPTISIALSLAYPVILGLCPIVFLFL